MADNEVEILVTGRDATDPMWAALQRKGAANARSVGAAVDTAMRDVKGSMARRGAEAGAAAGKAIADGIGRAMDGIDDQMDTVIDDGVRKGADRLRGADGRFRRAGESAGRGGGDGMRRGLVSQIGSMAGELASGLGGKLKPLLAKLPVGPPLAAALATAGPLMGAALSAAVVTGLSTAVIGGGIALAIQDPTVRAEASELGQFIGDELKNSAKPFIPATRQAIAIFRQDWNRVDGDIDDTFASAAKYVPTLAQGVSNAFSRLTPGIKDAVEGFEPIANTIANELPRVTESLSGLLSNMGEDAEDSATALALVFRLVSDSVDMINTAVTGLTKAWGGSLDMIERVEKVTPDWTPLGAAAEWLSEKVESLRGSAEGAGASLRDLTPPLDGNAHAAEAMAERTDLMSGTMAEAVEAAGSLKDALDVLNGGTLDARRAARNYQKSIDDLNEGLKENGRTLDINTEKGRENQQNLDNLASSISDQMNAVYAQTEATRGSAAAQIAANGVYERGRAQLIRSAMAAGMSATAARRYANSILGIPKNWKTDYKSNAAAARDAAREVGRAVNNIPSTKTITIRWDNPGNPLLAAAKARAGYAHGGVVGAAASGGVRSNRVMVGEDGPEIVDVPVGSMVHSNPDSRRMLAESDGGDQGGDRLEVRARFDPGSSSALQRAIGEAMRLEVWRVGTAAAGGTRWSPRQ